MSLEHAVSSAGRLVRTLGEHPGKANLQLEKVGMFETFGLQDAGVRAPPDPQQGTKRPETRLVSELIERPKRQ
jgi:hypothetical protein